MADWQMKFNNADERIKELERQVNATRKMREMLGGVKNEKIKLIRENMASLKGTYEKFLHENAMTAEDVRSEAMRSLDKYNKQKEFIAQMEERMEEQLSLIHI